MTLTKWIANVITATVLCVLVSVGQAVAQTPEDSTPSQDPVNLLTLARGAVLVEASHKPRDAVALIDGDAASFWSIATKRNPAPYTFTVELLAPAQLTAVGITGAGERPGGVVGGSAKTVRIEASSAPRGGPFQRLAEFEANATGTTLVPVAPSGTVHSLRFTVDGAQAADAPFLYIADMVAYGRMTTPEESQRFSGVFATGRATQIDLTQTGMSVTGCYSDNGGHSFGSIDGSVVDGVALTQWRSDDGITGTALLTIDSQGALSGVRYRQRSRSIWSGPRVDGPSSTPCADDDVPANPILDALDTEGEVKIYGILFNHNSDVPRSVSLPALTQLQEALEARPTMRILIEGHTDADGSDSYNEDLSTRRANAVVAWLIERAIAGNRLEAAGRGEAVPVASNDTADGKALNRRVEVSVVD